MEKTIIYLKQNIRYYRKLLNLSQQELAEKSDISTSFVQEIELGRKHPSLTTLDKLAGALDIEVFQLLMNPDKNNHDIVKDFSAKLKEKLNSDIDDLMNRY